MTLFPETAGDGLPPGLTGLITACLKLSVSDRPTAKQISETLEEAFRTHWRTTPDFELEVWTSSLPDVGWEAKTWDSAKPEKTG